MSLPQTLNTEVTGTCVMSGFDTDVRGLNSGRHVYAAVTLPLS